MQGVLGIVVLVIRNKDAIGNDERRHLAERFVVCRCECLLLNVDKLNLL